jgi:hypothetical protein
LFLSSVRVQIGSTPKGAAVVGVGTTRAIEPTVGVSGFALTGKASSASEWPSIFTWPRQLPGVGSVGSTT